MYADSVTPAMRAAIDETARRREIQDAYNKAHGIVPKTIIKSVRDLIEISSPTAERKGRTGVKMTKVEKERRSPVWKADEGSGEDDGIRVRCRTA